MDKYKQIEEIQAEIIRWGENADKTGNYRYNLSEHLVDNGYRKASEVVDEIFEKLKVDLKGYIGLNYLDELKKKHIGEDTNVLTNTEDGE